MINATNIHLESFNLVGISTRTTNQGGQSQIDIGRLWQQFLGENISAKIANKISNDTYCVYTDYESDFNGAYTTFLGCKVPDSADPPEGLLKLKLPQSKYLKIASNGVLPGCVVQTWKEIWTSPIERAYVADFDVYGEGCRDPQNATVDIYLSIK